MSVLFGKRNDVRCISGSSIKIQSGTTAQDWKMHGRMAVTSRDAIDVFITKVRLFVDR
jgi:hypothetical protein